MQKMFAANGGTGMGTSPGASGTGGMFPVPEGDGANNGATAAANLATGGGAAPTGAPAGGGGFVQGVKNLVQGNEYFAAGAGLYGLTILAVGGRMGLKVVQSAAKRKFVVSLETTNRDPSYQWLMQWMSAHKTFNFQQMSLITSNVTIHANEEITASSTFAPCPGIPHFMIHNNWPVVVMRRRQTERAAGSDVLEILEMSTLGMNGDIMKNIVGEAREMARARDSDKTVIYQNAGGRWIRQQESRARRPLQSVVLEGTKRESLVEDTRQFLDSADYYRSLGVPYRRGYLLHGPPGCGKSSLVMALAGELRLAICLLSLSNRSLDDESLNSLLNSAPLRSIVLMEDIDRAFTNDSRVTMSGLLNALDGVAAQEGRIVFMTTNHVERLDAALIRPGRADMKLEVGLVLQEQAGELFRKFYPKASPEQTVRFASSIPAKKISVAQLQSHLFLHRHCPNAAIGAVPRMVAEVLQFEQDIDEARERDRVLRDKLSGMKNPPSLF